MNIVYNPPLPYQIASITTKKLVWIFSLYYLKNSVKLLTVSTGELCFHACHKFSSALDDKFFLFILK